MPPKYRLCPKCRYRYERVKKKCPSCGRARPKKRVPKHAITLQRDSYGFYCEVARVLHGVTDERCCVCGKPRHPERRHDRDHDHLTGHPRGLACVQCNRIMVHRLTIDRAKAIVAYLERAAKYEEKFPNLNTKPEDQLATEGNH